MKHYKLFHPSVEICYYSDDVDKIPRSLGTDPKTLIPELFDVEHNLIGFQTSNDLHSSGWGYIGATDVSTPDFILAVNGRPIQHSGLKRKLRDSYKAFLGVQACRSLYLNLVLDPGQVDFNKDPKKSTVGLSMDLLDELSAEITHSLNRVRVESRPQSLVRSKDSGPENQNADQESANTTVLPDTIACHHIICQTPNTTYCLIVEASRRIFVIDGSQLTSAEELESDIESYEDQFTKMQQTDPGLVLNGVEIGFLRFLHLNSNQ
jgi:DNA mismatch repair ATPase MutL